MTSAPYKPICLNCHEEFSAQRSDAETCSNRCRIAWRKKRAALALSLPPPKPLHVFAGTSAYWQGDILVCEFEANGCLIRVEVAKGNCK